MKNLITKIEIFNEQENWPPKAEQPDMSNDPYGEEKWGEENAIQQVVRRYDEIFGDNAATNFVENYPTSQDYNEALINEYAEGMDDYEWDEWDEINPGDDGKKEEYDEAWKEFILDRACGDFEAEFLRVDVLQRRELPDEWADFYNELVDAGW